MSQEAAETQQRGEKIADERERKKTALQEKAGEAEVACEQNPYETE